MADSVNILTNGFDKDEFTPQERAELREHLYKFNGSVPLPKREYTVLRVFLLLLVAAVLSGADLMDIIKLVIK